MSKTPLSGAEHHDHGCLDAELLASYIDGRTTTAERAVVETHLAQCEDCYFSFSETVKERMEDDDASKNVERRGWIPWAAAGLEAAAAVVIAVSRRPQQLPTVSRSDNSLEQLGAAMVLTGRSNRV